jgi:K+-sensing histidine kinase KdpD
MSIANQEADNLTDLIEQLLDMTRISTRVFAISPRVESLAEVINTAVLCLP